MGRSLEDRKHGPLLSLPPPLTTPLNELPQAAVKHNQCMGLRVHPGPNICCCPSALNHPHAVNIMCWVHQVKLLDNNPCCREILRNSRSFDSVGKSVLEPRGLEILPWNGWRILYHSFKLLAPSRVFLEMYVVVGGFRLPSPKGTEIRAPNLWRR